MPPLIIGALVVAGAAIAYKLYELAANSAAKKCSSTTSAGSATQTCPKPKPGSSIVLRGTPAEKKNFEKWLDNIRKTPSGRTTLENIDKSGKQVTIQSDAASRATAGETVRGTRLPADLRAAADGTGVDTTILMDGSIPDHGSSWVYDSAGNKIPFTASQNLYHELSHAEHTTAGTLDVSDPEGQAIRQENIFRMEEAVLPSGVSGPPAPAPQRAGHGGEPRF